MNLPDSSPARAPTLPRFAIPSLALAAFASATSLRVTDPLLPRLASEFAVSLGEASYVITFFSVAYGISQLFFGPVGDRFGKYLVIAWACVACMFTAALCVLAPNLHVLLLARLLAGATAAAIIPLSMAWIGDIVPYERRQPVLARFLIGQILGVAAGQLIGGLSAEHGSWRWPFLGLAAAFALLSAVLFRVYRTLPVAARAVRYQPGAPIVRMIGEFRDVLERRWARVVLTSVLIEGAFVFGAVAFIASHLHRSYGVPLGRAGALVMLFGIGGFAFAVAAPTLVRRLGEGGLAGWGGVSLFLSLLAIGIAPAWWWAVPGCLLAGMGFYMLHNTLQTNATQMAPERRGVAVSAFSCFFYVGQSVGVA
jgi:predicted MFS family arabinose efflux permease